MGSGEIVTPCVEFGSTPAHTTEIAGPSFFVRPPIEIPDHLDRRMVAERHWAPPDGS
jgi:hypothetical protein